MRPRRGNIWALTEKGLQNAFVTEIFNRYDMKYIVPARWVLAGYVVEISESEAEDPMQMEDIYGNKDGRTHQGDEQESEGRDNH